MRALLATALIVVYGLTVGAAADYIGARFGHTDQLIFVPVLLVAAVPVGCWLARALVPLGGGAK